MKPFPLQNLPDPSDNDYSKTPSTIFFLIFVCVCVFETVRHFWRRSAQKENKINNKKKINKKTLLPFEALEPEIITRNGKRSIKTST